ncbi:MAG TPA: cytochrome c-type biogenesis protein, partial [Stellaceae bacterium]|nr:cytochrome c-type biogenesis protein [Stellaceae bacterium]
ERIAKGDTDRQAIQYIVNRYGDFVLLKPPVEPATYVLWFGPPAVLLLGGAGVALYLRRRRPEAAPAPLDPDERRRLDALLHEGEG